MAINLIDAAEYKRVEPYYGAVDSFANSERKEIHAEMTREQSGFLCGLLKKYRPRKILEVGVAAGGTTAIILNCLDQLEIDAEMYSVDLNKNLYYMNDKETGYVAQKYLSSLNSQIKHTFLLGKYLPEYLDVIGDEIDFVIIDTVHYIPGEIIDFLAVLPFLSRNAIVVLHDVVLSHCNSMDDPWCCATQVLFAAVTADKYLNNIQEYPNIAAFCVTDDTYKRIADVFSSLTLPWKYPLGDGEIKLYRNWYEKYYSSELCKVFEQAVALNAVTLYKPDIALKEYVQSLKDSLLSGYAHIILYGAGKRGQSLKKCLNSIGINEIEFVVTDNSSECAGVMNYDSIPYDTENVLIIIAAASKQLEDKLDKSQWHWLKIPEELWMSIERIYGE